MSDPTLEIVVEGYQVTITKNSLPTPGPYSGFTVTQTLSTKNKAENKKVVNGPIISWVTSGCSNGASGSGIFNANSQKCKSDNSQYVFLKNVQGTCTGTYTSPIPGACTCSLQITNANQTKVKGT